MKLNSICALAASAVLFGGASAGFGNIVVTITTNAGSTNLTSNASNSFGSGSFGGFTWQSVTVSQKMGSNATEFALDVAGLSNTGSGAASISFAGVDNNFIVVPATSATLLMSNGTVNSFSNSNASVSVSGSAQDVSPAGSTFSNTVITNQGTGTGTLYADSASNFATINPALTGNFELGNTLVVNNLPAVQFINDINGASSVNVAATATPEPMSLAVISLGLLPLLLLRRRARA